MKEDGGETSSAVKRSIGGIGRGAGILDFFLRIVGIIGTLGSAIAMGTTKETLPFFTQFIQFRARYDDLPSLTFFVVANSVVCGYLILTLMMSILHIIRTGARVTRLILIFLDSVMLGLITSGASAATAIVYLAHKGDAQANWFAICQQFNSFCERISGSLIGSYGTMVIFMLLIFLSALVLSRRT